MMTPDARNRGMTLVELMLLAFLFVFIVGMIGLAMLLAMKYKKISELRSQRSLLQMNAIHHVVSDRVWQSTVDNNDSMNCLKDPVAFPAVPEAGNCTPASGGPLDFYGESGTLLMAGADNTKGFTADGTPCDGFPAAGATSAECPLQILANWRYISPTQLAIDITSTYRGQSDIKQQETELRTFYRNIPNLDPCANDLIFYMALDEPLGSPVSTAVDSLLDLSSYTFNGQGVDAGGPNFNYSTGRWGNAAQLFGGNHIRVPDSECLVPDDVITISTWVRIDQQNPFGGDPAPNNTIIDKHYNDNWDSYLIRLRWTAPNQAKIEFCIEETGTFCTMVGPSRTFNPGVWYHVAAVYNGVRLRTFYNGAYDSELAYSGPIYQSNSPLFLGIENQAGMGAPQLRGSLQGALDQVRIYNRVLTDAEILNLYNNPL